jgi:ribosome-binding factor A
MGYKRSERVSDLLKREIGDIVEKDLKDPRIGFVTIMKVEVSADLRHARVFFSVFGEPRIQEETWRGLDSAKFFIQGEVGRRLRLRYTPELSFQFDHSVEHGLHISNLIKTLRKGRDDEPEGGRGGP